MNLENLWSPIRPTGSSKIYKCKQNMDSLCKLQWPLKNCREDVLVWDLQTFLFFCHKFHYCLKSFFYLFLYFFLLFHTNIKLLIQVLSMGVELLIIHTFFSIFPNSLFNQINSTSKIKIENSHISTFNS